ncbi:hypothetical protein BSL78_18506 [Apostichopus japonicus]|uniref:Uncharacterized protein n=1 Tax=Stichopus japonicus TaxID=307972 RepID=A0A2G8K9I4_STIJA|nr:hypothetical protein BSL78_18506 [Apostichopus japonicus]
MESQEVTPSTAGSSSVEDADMNQNKAGGSEVLLESDPPSDDQTTVTARRRTLERGKSVDPLAEEETAKESVGDKASLTKLETDLSGREKEDINAAKSSPSQSKEDISTSANNLGEQTVVDLEEVYVGNSSDCTEMTDRGREDTVRNGESSEVEDLVQMGGKLKSERQNEKSEPSEFVKNKKRLKKQLSVRFADDEDGPRSPSVSVTASAKSELTAQLRRKRHWVEQEQFEIISEMVYCACSIQIHMRLMPSHWIRKFSHTRHSIGTQLQGTGTVLHLLVNLFLILTVLLHQCDRYEEWIQ